jgi:ResB-like family
MKSESNVPRLLLVSPWFLFIFFVIPISVILSLKFHVQIPLASPRLLLVNNICFALLVACRLLRYLAVLGKSTRYDAGCRRPRRSDVIQKPDSEVRDVLTNAGYTFAADGKYGEKRDLGFFGTVVLYGGLLILLAVGSWDNLRQFTGVLLDGVGPSTNLSRLESYRALTLGPLAARPDSLPRMQVLNQILPDSSTYPKGATEIDLFSEDGKELRTILKPTDPVAYGAFDIYMTKLVFEPQIVIKNKDSRTLFDGFVKLDPLVQKRGDFSFYGLFVGAEVVGGVYYQPEKSLLMVVITRNDKRVVADMTFQVDQQVTKGDYILSCAKMGEWSEIHVVHRRHKVLIMLGGIIALFGLILRVAIRPQRVWLEQADGGSRVTAVGKETRNLLHAGE